MRRGEYRNAGGRATLDQARDRTNPFARAAEAWLFSDPAVAAQSVDAWEEAASAYGDFVVSHPQVELGSPEYPVELAPFLYIEITIGETVLRYSELDRAIGDTGEATAAQLEGRIPTPISDVLHAFGVEGIQRTTVTLQVLNHDAALNQYFRDLTDPNKSFLRAKVDIKVGFRTIPPQDYRPICGGFYIQDVQEITDLGVTLSLVDRVAEAFGKVRPVPTVGELYDAGLTDCGAFDEAQRDREIPVVFGRGWFNAVPFTKSGERWHIRENKWWVIGISRNPFSNEAGGWTFATRAEANGSRLQGLFEHRGGPRYVDLAAGLCEVRYRTITVNGEAWHVALLFLSVGVLEAGALTNETISILWNDAGGIWAQSPFGAEGGAVSEAAGGETGGGIYDHSEGGQGGTLHDPATIIAHLTRYYFEGGGLDMLDEASFLEVSQRSSVRGEWVAGEIRGGESGTDIVGKICASFDLDAFWNEANRVELRSRGFTEADLREHIPGAHHYVDDEHIVGSTWRERVPKGNERWGVANTIKVQGLKEYSPPHASAPWSDPVTVAAHGYAIEKTLEVSWLDTAVLETTGGTLTSAAAATRATARFKEQERSNFIVTFEAGLFGLARRLGRFLLVTHRAGAAADGGYEARLFRIEARVFRHASWTVEFELLDLGWFADEYRWVMDTEAQWKVLDAPAENVGTLNMVSGALALTCVGWNPLDFGIEVGMGIRIPTPDETDPERYAAIIDGVTSNTIHVEIELPATVSGIATFEIWRSWHNPPTNETHPGLYEGLESANDLYGSLADGTLTDENGNLGAFADDGASAYRLRRS